MRFGRKATLLCVILLTSFATLAYLVVFKGSPLLQQITHHKIYYEPENSESTALTRGFLVNTTHCKIPNIDPFDSSIIQFIVPSVELNCAQSHNISVTYTKGNVLKLNRTKIEKFFGADFKYCQYTPIKRGPKQSDFHFIYGNVSKIFDRDVTLSPENEFVRVDCYSCQDRRIARDFHAVIIPKEDVEKRADGLFTEHVKKHTLKETYNVLMVGVDSTSRLNFHRYMPKTRQFLQELQAFEMTGYNKVADNTFVNLIPILTGMFLEEMGWNETMANQPFDKYPLLWKNFSNAGYRTLFAEDQPNIGTFTYLKSGFRTPPTDYYNQPFMQALYGDKEVWSSHDNCVADRPEAYITLDYLTDLSRAFRDKPHFGFVFLSKLTHDNFDFVGACDSIFFTFLKRLQDEGRLKNTVLTVFSDHGLRFGNILNTYVGKLEERTPFMFLIFPPSFHLKYPELVKNLRTNARRLTTPFDIHETLKDILYFDGVTREAIRSSRGISLFREVPEDRTCDQAGILPHWCVCMEPKPLDTSSKLAIDIGNALVSQINAMLVNVTNVCASLRLQTVSHVTQMVSNEKVLRFKQSLNDVIGRTVFYGDKTAAPIVYQITISTLPGQALFEATVIYNPTDRKYNLGGDISRINRYGGQSDCLNNYMLLKFCFCV